MPQDRPVKEITIQAPVWEPFAGRAALLEMAAKSLHWVRPVAPHGAPTLDAVCDMKKRVNRERADWESLWVSLIVNSFSCQYHRNDWMRGLNPPLVPLDPINETRSDDIYVRSRNFTPQTKIEEIDEIDEVLVTFRILEGIP